MDRASKLNANANAFAFFQHYQLHRLGNGDNTCYCTDELQMLLDQFIQIVESPHTPINVLHDLYLNSFEKLCWLHPNQKFALDCRDKCLDALTRAVNTRLTNGKIS